MNSTSKLILFKTGDYEYIYIYFKHKGKYLRIPTGKKYVEGMHKKDLLYSVKMEGHEFLNRQILEKKNKVDQFISKRLEYSNSITQKECLNFIETGEFFIQQIEKYEPPKNKSFFDFYTEFYNYKVLELNNRPSVKDYKSLENALSDYQTYSKKKLTFEIIDNKEFFIRFRNYLSIAHAEDSITKGLLNDNTIAKRFTCLKTFMLYCEDNRIFTFKPQLFRFKTPKFQPDFVTLSKAELKSLIELEIENKHWKKIIDVFVCNCFMSLRYKDQNTLEKGTFIKDSDNDYYYTKMNEKTKKEIKIPITADALKILDRYDFKLPKYTNQYFNRQLKDIFEHYNLFKELIKFKTVSNGVIEVNEYMKRDLISHHTARRTFITLCINANVPINAIQTVTGHTQLSTLSKYIQHINSKEQFKGLDL